MLNNIFFQLRYVAMKQKLTSDGKTEKNFSWKHFAKFLCSFVKYYYFYDVIHNNSSLLPDLY